HTPGNDMEAVGKFEFSRKDLIGHGAFAVVFKGRHKEKPEVEVAIKCINKKNLAKSQTLLGKEIKILKELKHDNIVALYDFQVFCGLNGGVLSSYLIMALEEKNSFSYLMVLAKANCNPHPPSFSPFPSLLLHVADFGFARYLQNNMMAATLCGSPMYMAPEVIMSQHYDAKADLWSIGTIIYQCLTGKAPFQASSPQDLRLFYEKNRMLVPNLGSGSSSSSSSTSHLASPPSLGEMPHLQEKVPASPQLGSPAFLHRSKESAGSSSKNSSCDTDDFVMVPAQFTSKRGLKSSLVTSADLESQGRTPSPSPPYSSSPSPSGRSSQFSPSTRTGQSIPIPVPTQIQNYRRIEQNLQSPNQYTSPRSNPVKRSGSTSPLGFLKVSPSSPFSAGEHGTVPSPRRFSFGGAKPYTPSPQVGTIPEQSDQMIIPSPLGTELRTRVPISDASGSDPSLRGLGYRLHSAPNLSDFHSCRQKVTKQYSDPLVPHFSPVPAAQATRLPSLQSGRPLRSSPKLSEFMQRTPLPTILGSPTKARSPFEFSKNPSSQNLFALLAHQAVVITPTRNKTLPDLKEMGYLPYQQGGLSLRPMEDAKGRSLSTGRLTDLLLKAAFGEAGSNDSLNSEKPMEITAPSMACGGTLHSGAREGCSGSPSPVVFTVGSPPAGTTPPQTTRTRMYSVGSSSSLSSGGSFSGRHFIMGAGGEILEAPSGLRYTLADPIAANLEGEVTFEAPELPEETLMEQEHTDILRSLRFTLAFVHYVMELATIKGNASEMSSSVASEYQLQESVVADQISLLSKEWSYAEQLVLYLKVAELLSAGLQMAIDQIRAGKLCLSSTVKQIVRKLNNLYKSSVSSCHHLNLRLQRWFMDKQKLMDRINSITAEKLIFSHAVQMVQAAALDEMFHHREDCVQRYQKALLLMEGLLNFITEQGDVENINKCKVGWGPGKRFVRLLHGGCFVSFCFASNLVAFSQLSYLITLGFFIIVLL
uniref:non-specific serine/threonine protein kinase n=1 Tax=Naja naja TaxID=35670 RepID=A0A8C6Y3U1_NAJNA